LSQRRPEQRPPSASLPNLLLLALLAGASPAQAQGTGPDTLADGTIAESWKLPSGLRVAARQVSGVGYVGITLAFPTGTDHDPEGREGLARLVGELILTAGAGHVPERSRAEMDHLRPEGWELQAAPRFTSLTEVVTREQFPEVLRQMSARLAGVTVTPEQLKLARESAKGQLADLYFVRPATALYYDSYQVARGVSDEVQLRMLTGRGIEPVTVAEVERRLERHYGTSRAVLSIAGDFGGFDVRALVGNFFGSLPARGTEPPGPAAGLKPNRRRATRSALRAPLGAAAIIAPALEDSVHPYFYLASLLLGSKASQQWGAPQPPLTSRFEYVLFDDPSLVRFYPPPDAGDRTTESVSLAMENLVADGVATPVPSELADRLKTSLGWLMGGPIPENLLRQLPREATPLATLANTAAVRELWGGEEFWRVYRRRFLDARQPQWAAAMRMLGEGQRRVVLLLLPPAQPQR
jgi:hypothetical protein